MKTFLAFSLLVVVLSAHVVYASVKGCYSCEGDCTNPIEIQCSQVFDMDWVCGQMTLTFSNGTIFEGRDCFIGQVEGRDICDVIKEDGDKYDEVISIECTTCDTDYCN